MQFYYFVFLFTLASTAGGKDLGVVVGIEIEQRPNLLCFCLSLWFGLLCLTTSVWHLQFHAQSAMKAKGHNFSFFLHLLYLKTDILLKTIDKTHRAIQM